TVDTRVEVIAIEHTHSRKQRKGPRGYRARRQEIRPHGHIGKARERAVAIVALLLDPVRRDRSDLAQHVLPRVVDARAPSYNGLAGLVDVPHHAGARLKLLPLVGYRAVGGETRVAQEAPIRRRFGVDGFRHALAVPAKAIVDR